MTACPLQTRRLSAPTKIRLDNRFSIVHQNSQEHYMKAIISPISIILISVITKSRSGE